MLSVFGRLCAVLLVCGLVSACAVEKGASPGQIDQVAYRSSDPAYVSLVTMVNARTGKAAHSALIINASQQVIYDPAGTFQYRELVERGDIHYGASPRLVNYYKRYHARFSHFTHEQRVYVSPAVAETVLRRAQAQGPSPKMWCNIHVTGVLNDTGAFGDLRQSFFPEILRQQFARLPGVVDFYTREEDRAKTVPIN